MKSRPISIYLIAITHWLLLPAFLVYQAYLAQWQFDGVGRVIQTEALFAVTMAAFVGVGVWKVRVWGYVGFMLLSALIVGYLAFTLIATPQAMNYVMVVVAALLSGAIVHFLQSHIAAPYFNPQLRWWERSPRFLVKPGAEFKAVSEDNLGGQLRDISETGCFAQLQQDLPIGDKVQISVGVGKHRFDTLAKVIWKSRELNGYGFQFVGYDRERDKTLKGLIHELSHAPSGDRLKNRGLPVHKSAA
jgi:hypothetical protein